MDLAELEDRAQKLLVAFWLEYHVLIGSSKGVMEGKWT